VARIHEKIPNEIFFIGLSFARRPIGGMVVIRVVRGICFYDPVRTTLGWREVENAILGRTRM
jgi:hypothetical protein